MFLYKLELYVIFYNNYLIKLIVLFNMDVCRQVLFNNVI